MDYKEYYKKIKDRLKEYSDVVYYEPMSNNEILDLEKEIDMIIKPLYREFLSVFGMNQDVFDELKTDTYLFIDDFEFLKKEMKLEDYIPLHADTDDCEIIYLLNKDLQDDNVYVINDYSYDDTGRIRKVKPFQQIIEESISNLEKNHKNRCHNKDKVGIIDFIFSGKDFPAFVEIFEVVGFKQKTEWELEYHILGIVKVDKALFEFFDNEIVFNRIDDGKQYRFSLEEPVLTDRDKSRIFKTEQLLYVQKIKYRKVEWKPVEKEELALSMDMSE